MAASKKITVEVVHSTAKAHLVKDASGRQGWVRAASLKDGQVVAATFEKSVESAADRKELAVIRAEREAAERLFRNTDHAVRVVRETEKAVAAEIIFNFAGCDETKLVWFAKSMIGGVDGVAMIPGWLIRSKVEEALDAPAGSDYYARHRYCKGERLTLVRGVEILESATV